MSFTRIKESLLWSLNNLEKRCIAAVNVVWDECSSCLHGLENGMSPRLDCKSPCKLGSDCDIVMLLGKMQSEME